METGLTFNIGGESGFTPERSGTRYGPGQIPYMNSGSGRKEK